MPLAESLGALNELQGEGKIRHIGVSNVSVDEISQAAEVVDLASVQNELSPRFRSSEAEVAYCSGQGIAFLAWSPLGGISSAKGLGSEQGAFSEVAEAHGVSAQQVALAWELAKAPVVIPIPGSSRPETIRDSVRAAELDLSEEELARLDG